MHTVNNSRSIWIVSFGLSIAVMCGWSYLLFAAYAIGGAFSAEGADFDVNAYNSRMMLVLLVISIMSALLFSGLSGFFWSKYSKMTLVDSIKMIAPIYTVLWGIGFIWLFYFN